MLFNITSDIINLFSNNELLIFKNICDYVNIYCRLCQNNSSNIFNFTTQQLLNALLNSNKFIESVDFNIILYGIKKLYDKLISLSSQNINKNLFNILEQLINKYQLSDLAKIVKYVINSNTIQNNIISFFKYDVNQIKNIRDNNLKLYNFLKYYQSDSINKLKIFLSYELYDVSDCDNNKILLNSRCQFLSKKFPQINLNEICNQISDIFGNFNDMEYALKLMELITYQIYILFYNTTIIYMIYYFINNGHFNYSSLNVHTISNPNIFIFENKINSSTNIINTTNEIVKTVKRKTKAKLKSTNNKVKICKQKIKKRIKDTVWDTYIGKKNGVGSCYVCSCEIDSKHFECGHIISEADGGKIEVSNLRPVCERCNKEVGTTNMDKYKEEINNALKT